MTYPPLLIGILLLTVCSGCGESAAPQPQEAAQQTPDPKAEKAAILHVLNEETRAAFQRDYAGWADQWVQTPYVTKSYMNLADGSMTETLGWEEISGFLRNYFEEHPEPDPLPTPLTDIDVRLYGNGAWVSYTQNDPGRGRKRETRLMEKIDGRWKIAGMHTTIYGFSGEEAEMDDH